ncbi:hypothetical protein [Actinoplanes palleronii]|uniref:Uncharacterized protein n=1 Tax=Actinoplanes palleronii TaxID=113570 RepID=A0ABQ4BQW5_9ACTN|nr:hypothetical protein Apa02nite_091250 [Actinoplanes palleronii]
MPDGGHPWLLSNFDRWISWWVQECEPPLRINITVRGWVVSRAENPFEGARFVPGFDDLLFAAIPGTLDEAGQVVTCTYRVIRADWTVYCSMIGTASWPV